MPSDATESSHGPLRSVVVPAATLDRSRLHEDITLLAELGAKELRIGIDWAWMQPAAGAVNVAVFVMN